MRPSELGKFPNPHCGASSQLVNNTNYIPILHTYTPFDADGYGRFPVNNRDWHGMTENPVVYLTVEIIVRSIPDIWIFDLKG